MTEDDILEFDLASSPIDARGRGMYAERPIHGCIYRARTDVQAVCHSQAHQLIPFAVTGMPLKPVWVMGAAIGDDVPLWDIREDFPNDDGMLIVNDAIGSAVANRLGAGRACLLAGRQTGEQHRPPAYEASNRIRMRRRYPQPRQSRP